MSETNTQISEGSVVKCAFCRKEAKVVTVIEHDGETAYNLSCLHRNTFCPNCQQMAKDDSETIRQVVRLCETCDGVADDDDDDDDE